MGQHLKAARERIGLTQAQVAERVGRDQSAISKYESGARPDDLDVIARLADVLGLTREEVLFGTGKQTPAVHASAPDQKRAG